MKDMVNHPDHYKTKSGLETIDVIEAFTDGLEGIEAVDTGNALKYLCRWKKKNGKEDLKKARWYINHLISHLGGEEDFSEHMNKPQDSIVTKIYRDEAGNMATLLDGRFEMIKNDISGGFVKCQDNHLIKFLDYEFIDVENFTDICIDDL